MLVCWPLPLNGHNMYCNYILCCRVARFLFICSSSILRSSLFLFPKVPVYVAVFPRMEIYHLTIKEKRKQMYSLSLAVRQFIHNLTSITVALWRCLVLTLLENFFPNRFLQMALNLCLCFSIAPSAPSCFLSSFFSRKSTSEFAWQANIQCHCRCFL